jgi:hypothetical protein
LREHLIWDGATFAPAHAVMAQRAREARKHRSALPAPYFISDDLGPNGLLNHADNKVYTSKAEYVRGVKRAGCEIVGTDTLTKPKYEKPKLADDVKRDIRGWVETKFRAKKGQRYR